ncbi:MAG: hypothetical protein WAT93_07035 [Pontixanthobacter sp.]
MTQIQKALLLATAMIGIAVLAVFDIIPEAYAQYAPIALLALFPSAWMGKDKPACGAKR